VTEQALQLLFVGLPNVGKSSLINSLTGSTLNVGNWTGTTVEKRSLSWAPESMKKRFEVIDLPGSFSLEATSPEEEITRQVLLEDSPPGGRILVNVLDSGHLERDLYLTLEVLELGLPTVVVLNLADEAKKFGKEIDAAALEKRLGVPVVSTVAVTKDGGQELHQLLSDYSVENTPQNSRPAPCSGDDPLSKLENRLAAVLDLSEAITTLGDSPVTGASLWQKRWDRALLHLLLGPLLFLVAMLLVFRFTFLLSDPWITFLGTLQEVLAGWVVALPIPAILASFLGEGVIGGLGTVAAFSPVLFFLYFGNEFSGAERLFAPHSSGSGQKPESLRPFWKKPGAPASRLRLQRTSALGMPNHRLRP
jgi:ferrous iron transport protein B